MQTQFVFKNNNMKKKEKSFKRQKTNERRKAFKQNKSNNNFDNNKGLKRKFSQSSTTTEAYNGF